MRIGSCSSWTQATIWERDKHTRQTIPSPVQRPRRRPESTYCQPANRNLKKLNVARAIWTHTTDKCKQYMKTTETNQAEHRIQSSVFSKWIRTIAILNITSKVKFRIDNIFRHWCIQWDSSSIIQRFPGQSTHFTVQTRSEIFRDRYWWYWEAFRWAFTTIPELRDRSNRLWSGMGGFQVVCVIRK